MKYIVITLLFCLLCANGLSRDYYWTSVNVSCFTQGDAHLIGDRRTNRAILIDSGPANYAANVLLPYLRSKGIGVLDAVFITHVHVDHVGGLIELLRSDIIVKNIFVDLPPSELIAAEWWGVSIPELTQIADLARQRNVNITKHADWQKINLADGFYLEKICAFTGAELNERGLAVNLNNMSLVCKLVCGSNTVLFTGDIDRDVGAYLAEHFSSEIKCDILKVPHHGAEGVADDSFFYATRPAVAIVPAPRLLWESERCARVRRLLDDLGCVTWVNGIHGHISVEFAGVNGGYSILQETVPPELQIKLNEAGTYISVSVTPNAYLMRQADWWILAHTKDGWYFFDGAQRWRLVNDMDRIFPSYQGPLISVNEYNIIDMPIGCDWRDVRLYFCVDKLDGRLNMANDQFFCAVFTSQIVENGCCRSKVKRGLGRYEYESRQAILGYMQACPAAFRVY